MSEPTLESKGEKIVRVATSLRNSNLSVLYIKEAQSLTAELSTLINASRSRKAAVFIALFTALAEVTEDYPEELIQ